ncbi:non-hydrolyzing UDP-N-acetylglucosamine 2-epimerase [Alkaliphilus serpentinus]|uniref:UDP-N-acetylglucosamine 2-epimerase (non-hydrolyzing) n=1 Tax=Alkaliphilus serpentinus TaxID=1482731 RepID=A0A833M9V7_9FIRM|nr:UDP-N-acetylglucosamine 2-epimerase (non-hydrolyzing) [Alkaliphilus serpentinus]KAB3530890.1 UDP-N-acetylglucosamine 2-epimerase (non-hydrolyzing) [Alkaliphilus serpentinus]
MKKLKVLTVFGTRPEAIKMAPLVKALEKNDQIQSIVCVTAQHREMLDMVLRIFEIKPDYDLNIMKNRQSLSDITVGVLKGIEEVLNKEEPDIILVHGDTSTTFTAALAAFYQKIKVGHVEAGLRTGNMYSPYPEEINRKLTATLANLHFAPTEENYKNLINEGIDGKNIFITGNTVIDALLQVVKPNYFFKVDELNKIDFVNKKVIAMTCHRRENQGKPMEDIFEAIKEVVAADESVEVIYPVHLSPAVREIAFRVLGDVKGVHLIEPLEYEDFANLMNKAYMIITDSGGLQEEAPSLGKPILVVRTETERPEAVAAGTVRVVGVNKENIVKETRKLLQDNHEYNQMANAINPYGDGRSSERIVKALLDNIGIL